MGNRTIRRVEEKKSAILAVAKEIFQRKGRQTRMADIAQSAGLETSSLYYYFKGIPEVLDALLHDQYRDLQLHEQEVAPENLSNMGMLREMIRYLLEFYHDNFDLVQIILAHVSPLFQDPELEEESQAINEFLSAYRRADELLLSYIRRSRDDGELSVDMEPEAMLAILRGTMWGIIASWRFHHPDPDTVEDCIDRILRVIA